MKKTRYRLDKEDIKGNYKGSIFFNTLKEAEKHIGYHKYMIDFEANAISNNKKYATIWEV